jgi:HD-GYP domain-containing protein (c-di-GMP phosphodiesterase class II)
MPRLTDIIKQGRIPEREEKKEKENSPTDKIRVKDLSLFVGSGTESITQQEIDKDSLLDAQFPKEREEAYTEVKVEGRGKEKNFDWLYEKVYSFVQDIMTVVANGRKLNIDEGVKIINQIADNLDSIDALYRKGIYTRETLDPFISHSVNAAIYAIKIGIGLKYDKSRLTKLGIGALLHDIGMAKMPREVINKIEKLTSDEFALIKKHPQYGYEILLTLGEDYRWLAEIAFQEHEREGGQGYPQGLKGNSIGESAKIVGVVDIYEALTHPRVYRKRFLPYEAVKEIIGSQRGFFHPKIMKVLITQLSVFPLHSYVRLNSNAIGKVIETNENYPLSPTIQILYDSQGGRIQEKKIIKLAENSLLHIKDSIFEEDLPG